MAESEVTFSHKVIFQEVAIITVVPEEGFERAKIQTCQMGGVRRHDIGSEMSGVLDSFQIPVLIIALRFMHT